MTITDVNIAKPDVTLHLDDKGVIERAELSSAFGERGLDAWIGRPWVETVADVGDEKIARMMEDARRTGVSAFRQITQRFPSGREIPMEYTTVSLGNGAGLIAIGKNLQAVAELQSRLIAAQRAMEQDYWKLRHIETRYRLLFDVSTEPVVLIHATDLRTIEANPAAIRTLGISGSGQEFLREIASEEKEQVEVMLRRVREQGKAPGILVHLGRDRKPWLIRASLMTSERGPDYLIQLTPAGAGQIGPAPGSAPPVEGMIDRLPDGVVVVDRSGRIFRANPAFVEMVQMVAEGGVNGERLDRWLRRPGADARALIENVRMHRTIGLFPTVVSGELGTEREVEISAAESSENPEYLLIVLRDVERRLPATAEESELSATLAGLTGRIGKTKLRELIKETVGAVEKHYILSALELTDGNRTSAASLLGLSRQSLYLKLNRYGLRDGGDASEPPKRE